MRFVVGVGNSPFIRVLVKLKKFRPTCGICNDTEANAVGVIEAVGRIEKKGDGDGDKKRRWGCHL